MITELRIFTEAGILTLLAIFLFLGSCAPRPRPWEGLFTRNGIHFSDQDRQIIRRFYSRYKVPPELPDPEVLARDPAKRIENSAALPPEPGGAPLPVDLESRLSRLTPGYVRFRVGNDAVLMDSRTREVLDVIPGVFP
jgi:hypothetical protein